MPVGDFFQEYGPINRRRKHGTDADDAEQVPGPPPELKRPDSGEPEPRSPRRARRRRPPRRPFPLLRLSGVLLLTLLLGIVLLPYALQGVYQGRAMPGVTIQGMPVDDFDTRAIQAALQARHAEFLRQPVVLHFNNQTWEPDLAELGASLDTESTIAAAMQPGRQGDPLTRLRELWQLWRGGVDIAPRLHIDTAQLQEYVLAIAAEVESPPRDAALSISGARVMSTPSAEGRQVLVDQSVNDILRGLVTLTPQEVTLRTRVLEPVVGDETMLAARNHAEELLSAPLVLRHNDESWLWDAEQLGSLLTVERVGDQLQVVVRHDQLSQEVERLAQIIDSGSAEPRLRFAQGALQITQPGERGWRVQQAPALTVISETLTSARSTTETVRLPADEIYPIVTPDMLAELGIHELLGEGRSSFAGSAQYRITNIKAGAARIDGVLIPPGEEFSFNTHLGEVNAENGFVEGYAVVGNRTRLEWGGGVCQDSTTVFRAAFWAGLPITERHAHPFYISWYDQFGLGPYGDGAGLDAAIFTGQHDLRFLNDTEHWVLLQTSVDEASQVMTVQLYGTNPNERRVEIDGPHISNRVSAPATPVYIEDASRPAGTVYQSDAARDGWDITITRIVYENGVEVSREDFFTRFKAWPNVFIRGTGSG